MKYGITLLLFTMLLTGCSRVSQDRLEGSWNLISMEEKGQGNTAIWSNWLDTTEVKVSFFSNSLVKCFYFENDILVGFSNGDYILLADEEQIAISDTGLVFNPHGTPIDITSLKKDEMILEGKYFLHAVNPSLPTDSFITLEWTFQQ